MNSERIEIDLHRRVCVIKPDVIDVRPARSAAIAPLIGFLLGVGAFLAALFLIQTLPFFLVLAFMFAAILLVPFSGMGFVYSVYGANVVIDRGKRTALWQQGLLGMGVGTEELVPFEKIERVEIEDVSPEVDERLGGREFAQFDIRILKKSGRRLSIGQLNVPAYLADDALDRARAVGEAIAEMTGRPLEMIEAGEPSPKARRRRPASSAV